MKKKLFALLLALIMAFALIACESETEYEYRILDMTTTLFNGSVNKTEYHYNENWVLTGMTVSADGQIQQEITVVLNEHGNPRTFTYTMADGTVVEEEYESTYDAKGNLTHQEVFQNGTLTSTLDQTFDAEGTRLTQTATNHSYPGGGIITEYVYNADGTTASMTMTTGDLGTSRIEYTYDDNGNQVRSVTTNELGTIISETNTSYNQEGQKTLSVDTIYDENGVPMATSAAEYTWEGNVVTTRGLNPDGSRDDNYSITEYDEAGNMIRSEIYAGDQLMTSQVCTYEKVEVPTK